MYRGLIFFLGIALAFATPVAAAPVTIEDVIALNAAGIGDDAIIAKISGSNTVFDLTTDQIIALKRGGLSGPVIVAMINSGKTSQRQVSADSPDPLVPHATGVYLLDQTVSPSKMVRIDATVSNQAKTGGIIGYALTGGIASLSVKAVI